MMEGVYAQLDFIVQKHQQFLFLALPALLVLSQEILIKQTVRNA